MMLRVEGAMTVRRCAGALVRLLTPWALLMVVALPVRGQEVRSDSSLLTIDRIFASEEFRGAPAGGMRWLADGTSYLMIDRAGQGQRGQSMVRVDARTGEREVLVPASRLVPPGDTVPLAIEGSEFTPDRGKVLIFTSSQPVWRSNTRGDYWVLDRATWRLHKLGGPAARPSTLMFAKFSPDGRRVAYVRAFNLYVEDVATGRITQLTRDGSRTTINGTTGCTRRSWGCGTGGAGALTAAGSPTGSSTPAVCATSISSTPPIRSSPS